MMKTELAEFIHFWGYDGQESSSIPTSTVQTNFFEIRDCV